MKNHMEGGGSIIWDTEYLLGSGQEKEGQGGQKGKKKSK